MRRPLVLVFLLGAWCAATVFMWQVPINTFAVADQVLLSDEEAFRASVGDLPDESLRLILRHLASEVNRLVFQGWAWVQIPLAIAVFLLARRELGGRLGGGAAGVIGLVTLFLALYVVPESIRLGQLMDFAAADDLLEVRSRFWLLHHTYTGLDTVKLLVGLVMFWLILRKRPPVSVDA